MQTFMNFLVNNYLWFLIISLILVFALIGYLVDTSEKAEKKKREQGEFAENIEINTESFDNVSLNIQNEEKKAIEKSEIEVLDDL